MTLPQFQAYSPGEIVDRSRTKCRSRCYDAPLKTYTVTVGGTATSGVYSFDVDGTTVSFTANTGAGDDNTDIAVGLYAAAIANGIDVVEICAVSRNALVITLTGRETGDSFTVDNAVVTGPGTLTIANTEDGVVGNLELGIGVSLLSTDANSIRRPLTGDTKIFGVVMEGGGLIASTGAADDVDAYAPGSAVEIARVGVVPLVVEEAVSAGDPIYCRIETDSGKVQGNFRNDAGGVFQVTRGDVAFSTTDAVGLTVDSLPALSVASDTSDDITVAALRNAWNASAQHFAVATATIDTSGAESYIILTFKDYEDHTVVAYSPATADVTGITNTTDAVTPRAVLVPGEFISDSYTDPASGKTVALADINLP